jgi:hypothetical protein
MTEMKRYLVLFCMLFAAGLVKAQDTTAVTDLQQLNAAAKGQYVTVETLDRLQRNLRYFDEHPVPKDQQQLLLDTYRAIAAGYLANNHFKQGYGVYQKLLVLKESFLSTEKSEAITKANSHIEEIQRKDEDELAKVQNEIRQLETDSDYLQAKRKGFKKYFSFIIVTLTVVFAFLLLQAGLKLNKIKSELNAGRERLKTIHRIATLGKLKSGVLLSVNAALSAIKKLSEESSAQLEQLSPGEKNGDVSNLRKHLNELKKVS